MDQFCAALRRDFGEGTHLLVDRIGDGFRGHLQFEPAEVLAVGIARMRANGDARSHRLFDGRSHSALVASVTAASDVRRGDGAQQRLLRAVGNGLRQLAHVAVEINARHLHQVSTIRFSDASNFSCSISSFRAVAKLTSSKRASSRGRSWPTLCRSAEITLAIFA